MLKAERGVVGTGSAWFFKTDITNS